MIVLLAAAGGADDDLATAQRQFELHNYKTALQVAERYLEGLEMGGSATQARVLRAECLLKLRRWSEGVAAMEKLFADHPALDKRPDLHVVLAKAAAEQHRQSAAAITHWKIASELFEQAGDGRSAAEAAIRCGTEFVYFRDWEKLDWADIEPPSDWRATRRLQRRFAVKWLDRGIKLANYAPSASAAMLRKGQLLSRDLRLEDDDLDKGMAVYRELVERWPSCKEAPIAELKIGTLLERYRQDFVGAVQQYRKVCEQYPKSRSARRARERMEEIVKPIVNLGVEGPVLPGEPGQIQLQVRNVAKLLLEAYRVDLFDLIRQIGHRAKLSEWSPSGSPVAAWSVDVPDTGEHKLRGTREETMPAVTLPESSPGAYVVVATADGTGKEPVRAVGLMIVSRLATVAKGAKGGGLIWAVDAITGAPVSGARVLVQEHIQRDRYDYREGKTADDGLFRTSSGLRKGRGGHTLSIYARDGEHYAACNSSFFWYGWGYPNDYRVYSFTDRPVYRPDQDIHFKHVLRRYEAGDYQNVPHKQIDLTVRDAKGQTVYERTLTTNKHGSVSGEIVLPKSAALGLYRMQIQVDGRYVHGGPGASFRLEEYRKPEYEVTVSADKPRYAPGETVDARIDARYYFGSPVADAAVTYTVHRAAIRPAYRYPAPYPWLFEQLGPWWARHNLRCVPSFCFLPPVQPKSLVQRGELRTDSEGVAILRITPEVEGASPAEEKVDFRYIVDVEVTDSSRRTVTGSGTINVTATPFTLDLQPQRRLYQPGDNVQIDIEARGPNNDPVTFNGTMRVHRLVRRDLDKPKGTIDYVLEPGDLVSEGAVQGDAEGRARFRMVADDEGPFRFVLTVDGGDGKPVTGECDVWIARRDGRLQHYAYTDIELVPDRYVYEIGQTARVLVNSRHEEGYVLLTIEADDLLDHRIIKLSGGSKVIEFPVESMHTPNFYLAATLIHDNKVFQDMQAVVVPPTGQFLSVEIESPAETFAPREEAQFTVTTTDSGGKPVDAELALMMVDASLYYIQPELREAVQKYFYGKIRPHIVGTQTSFDLTSGGLSRRYGALEADVAHMAAPMAAEGRMAKAAMADGGAEEPAFAAAEIRRDFPDSVLWAGHVDTGADGQATVDIAFPDTLTTWRLIAVAIDDQTRVGEASGEYITRKEVMARLQTPRFLVEGDLCHITVIARNDLDTAKTARVSLETSGPVSMADAMMDGRRLDYVKPGTVEVRIDAGSEATIDFEVMAIEAGAATFTGRVATDVLADAMEFTIPVVTFGSPKLVAQTGVIRGDGVGSDLVSFTMPQEMDPATPILEVHLNPTIAGVMLEAIPYLMEYPYGCTEQTMSRFLPAVITRHTLDSLGVQLRDLAARARSDEQPGAPQKPWRHRHPVFKDALLDDIVAVGLGRLTKMQQGDGGWGWWRAGSSDPYMTAYVVYGLAEARRAGVDVDQTMLDRGVAFVKACVVEPARLSRYRFGADDPNVRLWMLYALSVVDPGHLAGADIRGVIDDAFVGRDDLTDYTRAMLALVLHSIGDGQRTRIVIDNLENSVRLDQATQTASWGRASGYYRWYNNGLETTAMVLRALLATSPNHPHIHAAANWLVRSRQGARWHSTKDTAFAVYGLAEYLAWSGELEADMTVTVTLDDRVTRSFRITPDNVLTFDTRMVFAPYHVTPGEHTIRIEKEGKGSIYYATYVDYYTKEDPIEPAGHEIIVQRRYVRLIPKEVDRTRRVWDYTLRRYAEQTYRAIDYDREPIARGQVIAVGDLIEVELEIDARNTFEYIVIEDPKPAGCEPVSLHSGGKYGEGLYTNVEMRDKHVAFFVGHLRQGVHKLSYRLRCETPGTFAALPTRLEAMYSPYVRANGASDRLTIGP